jgi:hypothetical protein
MQCFMTRNKPRRCMTGLWKIRSEPVRSALRGCPATVCERTSVINVSVRGACAQRSFEVDSYL